MEPARSDRQPQAADHQILQRIGVGAYGEVWLARSVAGRLRAVKVVWRDRFDHDRTFEREFAGLQKFEPLSRQHEGLVDVLQIGRNERSGCFYYVMELADPVVEGESSEAYRPLTLASLIQSKGRLAVSDCMRLGREISEALAFLHRQGLVHRDVKPSNIIFVEGKAKLADIGLIASLGDAQSFVGTDGFIPPEGPGTPRGDVYGLGKTLYEMATGKNRLDFPDLPSELLCAEDAGHFAELNETILRACAANPEERHASAEDLRKELLLLESGRSIRKLRRNEKLVRAWRRVGVGAMVLALAGSAALWEQTRRAQIAVNEAARETRQRQAIAEKELAARQNLYAADMNLAHQALIAGNYARAESLLAACLPKDGDQDLRGFEWRYLAEKLRGNSIATIRGHEQVVSSLALSADGQRLYSASFDTTVREWSLSEQREIRQWKVPGSLFMTIALHPDETLLAGEGGNRPMSSLLDLKTGEWRTHASSTSPSVAFAPEGDRLVRGTRMLLFDTNATVEITDLDLHPLKTLENAGGRVAFSRDGRTLATGPWGSNIKLWDWPALKSAGQLEGAGTVMAMQFSTDGSKLASVSRDGRLQLWDWRNRKLAAERSAHGGGVIWSVAFSPDGSELATGGNDQTVRVWDANTLQEKEVYRGHAGEVWSVIWSRDGQQLISSGKDTTIRIWNAKPAPTAEPIRQVVQGPLFSKDGKRHAARLRDGSVVVRDTADGEVVATLKEVDEVGGFASSGELNVLRPGGEVQRIRLSDSAILDIKHVAPPPPAFTRRFLTADGKWLLAGMKNGEVVVQETEGKTPTRKLAAHSEMIVSLAVSPDGKLMLSGSLDRTARLWDLASGEELRVFTAHRMGVSALAFSSDGRTLATGSWDDTVHVWSLDTDRGFFLTGHEGGVQAVAFSPDGRTLASMTGASSLKLWSLAAQRETAVIPLPPGAGQSWLAFSPNGEHLAAVSQAQALMILTAP